MEQLSDTEKQELGTKIQDEQERQRTLRMNPNRPAVSPEVELTFNLLWNYGFLVLIFCLLAYALFILFKSKNFAYDQYGGLMIALMLLFNHVAYYLTTKGWKSILMRTVAWVWIALVFAYLFWIT